MKAEPIYDRRGGKPKPTVTGTCTDCGNPSDKMIKGLCDKCYSKSKWAEKNKRRNNFPF